MKCNCSSFFKVYYCTIIIYYYCIIITIFIKHVSFPLENIMQFLFLCLYFYLYCMNYIECFWGLFLIYN